MTEHRRGDLTKRVIITFYGRCLLVFNTRVFRKKYVHGVYLNCV